MSEIGLQFSEESALNELEGLDEEQRALCRSREFWEMISARRCEPTISREELDEALNRERESHVRDDA